MADMATRNDRRRHKRTRVLFSGCLVSGDQSVQGTMLDLSAGGARIRLTGPLAAPSAITLRLARRIDFHVEPVWSSGGIVGLRFREAPSRISGIFAGLLAEDALGA
jgi:hypothetical protein